MIILYKFLWMKENSKTGSGVFSDNLRFLKWCSQRSNEKSNSLYACSLTFNIDLDILRHLLSSFCIRKNRRNKSFLYITSLVVLSFCYVPFWVITRLKNVPLINLLQFVWKELAIRNNSFYWDLKYTFDRCIRMYLRANWDSWTE